MIFLEKRFFIRKCHPYISHYNLLQPCDTIFEFIASLNWFKIYISITHCERSFYICFRYKKCWYIYFHLIKKMECLKTKVEFNEAFSLLEHINKWLHMVTFLLLFSKELRPNIEIKINAKKIQIKKKWFFFNLNKLNLRI